MSLSLRVQNLEVVKGGRSVLALKELEVKEGEVLALIGPNGAGKSTLLMVLSLLEKPGKGEVFFAGQRVFYRRDELLRWRRRLAVVFQEPLLLNTSVFANVAAGLRFRGLPRREIKERVEKWLHLLGIAHLAGRRPHELSGGEAQRVSLARALALEPEALFLDEPFASLDAPTRLNLLYELKEILRQTGITAVFVTHDFTELPFLAHRVAALISGRLVQVGSPEEILNHPSSLELARLVGVSNIFPGVAHLDGSGPVRVELASGQRFLSCCRASGPVNVCLRPEEIVLWSPGAATLPKKANILPGRVVRILPQSGLQRVELDCGGLTLLALVSTPALKQAQIQVGAQVMASFSPHAVHLIPGSAHHKML
ncbi:MAG: tungstate transport system ATP-binding protein [Clostridia bacterium]|nr:tungstate transport system ATP-binding protein [Clostridia bacterium]